MLISITTSLHVITILANVLQSLAITNTRQFKRHIGGLADWEIGLREATYYALIRERRIRHPHLKEYLYSAPLLGRQNTATPFGDIAIVARGQLYSAPGGFQFVQDRYQNDCDGCHNTPLRCDRSPCEYWTPEDHERLLALWTVKRIRHRDSQYGFRYDFEYKISPMSSRNGKPFITRNGNFDYSLEGHKFLVQRDSSKPNVDDFNPYKHVYNSPTYDSNRWSPSYEESHLNSYLPPLLPPPPEEYSDEDPRNQPYGPSGNKDVFYQPELFPITSTKQTTSYTKNVNHDLYNNNAIGTLTSKFTTGQVPSSTPKTTDEADFLFPKQKSTSHTKIPFLPTRPTTIKNPTLKSTTKMRFSTDRLTTLPTYFSESTYFVQYSEPDPLYSKTTLTTPPSYFLPTIPPKTSKPSTLSTSSDNDYNIELFGTQSSTLRSTSTQNSQSVNDYMLFGEQAITIVSPPSAPIKDNVFDDIADTTLANRFGMQTSTTDKHKMTQILLSKQPTTTSIRSTPIKFSIKPTQPTRTTNKKFFITKKPLQVTEPSVILVSTEKNINKKNITYMQMVSSTSTTTESVEQIQSTAITKTEINENTVIDLSTSTETSLSPCVNTEIKSTTPYSEEDEEEYFETSTKEMLTTKTLQPPTTTTRKDQSTRKTTKANRVTTEIPIDTSEIDDDLFQLNIFGNSYKKPSPTNSTKSTSTPSSDIEDIFGNNVKDFYSTETNTPKIIFSNFFLPSPIQSSAETTTFNSAQLDYTTDIQNETLHPVTSQSYITSVSFEVNKKTSVDDLKQAESTISRAVDNVSVPLSYADKGQITQSSKILETLTMSVLSHAKSINYLSEEQINNSSPRSKRNIRKQTRKIIRNKINKME